MCTSKMLAPAGGISHIKLCARARCSLQQGVRVAAEASLKGEINYNFADKKLTGEIYFPPVICFINVQIETKGFVEFELVDYQKSIEVADKFTLYEYSKQF